MARKIGRVTADIGKYQQGGEEKTRWLNCGAVFENQGKLSIKMEAYPASPEWSGWFRIFMDDGLSVHVQGQAQPRGGYQQQPPQQQNYLPQRQAAQDFDDDAPF